MLTAIVLASGVAVAATINGTDGADKLEGTDNSDTISGRRGSDEIRGNAGRDRLYGNEDADKILGGKDEDTIQGNDGNDNVGNVQATRAVGGLYGGYGADSIDGGPGDDRIVQGPLDDAAQDTLYGGDGNDLIHVSNAPSASKDIVNCGAGNNDVVYVDDRDVVSSDCEVVKNSKQEAQKTRSDGARLESAVAAFERHMYVGSDGELELDESGLDRENVAAADRRLLEDALAKTNQRIDDGEIQAEDVFPSSDAPINPFQGASARTSAQGDEITAMQTCFGESGTQETWFATVTYLDSCQAAELAGTFGAGSALVAGVGAGSLFTPAAPAAPIFGAVAAAFAFDASLIATLNGDVSGVILYDIPGGSDIDFIASQ